VIASVEFRVVCEGKKSHLVVLTLIHKSELNWMEKRCSSS